MSILLDSLKQKKDDEGMTIPSVHDSHFDDEMLNDDALIKSNQLWKLTSILLFIILSFSWIYFYLGISRNSESSTNINFRLTEDKPIIEQPRNLAKRNTSETTETNLNKEYISRTSSVLVNNKSNDGNDNSRRNQYQPQKRKIFEGNVSRVSFSKQNIVQKNEPSRPFSNSDFANSLYSSKNAISYDELSTELLIELPNLKIDSYAVSSNPKKSFIVLNGSFYGVGETIAPNLKILSIDEKNVLFKYKSQLIKKNYK